MAENRYPDAFQELMDFLKNLPGIGARSAERIGFSMLEWPAGKLRAFGENITSLPENVTSCPACGNLSSKEEICSICSASNRDESRICVVESASQIINIESSGLFKGLYHVLGGTLSPIEGRGPEKLKLEHLEKRIARGAVSEIILALSPDVEGQATAIYMSQMLEKYELHITCLARGLPAGSNIAYADSATIAAAFKGRTDI